MIAYSAKDDLYLLYHWGNGDKSGELINGCVDGYTNGPPPSAANVSNPDSMYTFISYSSSLDGPWKEEKIKVNYITDEGEVIAGLEGADEFCLSSPYIFDNGSILMTWTQRLSWERGSVISLVFGDSWNATYNFSTTGLWTTQLSDLSSMEDPFLWRDAEDDSFHLLMHGMIEVDNPGGNPWARQSQGRRSIWLQYDKTFNLAVPLYTKADYCEMGKREFC